MANSDDEKQYPQNNVQHLSGVDQSRGFKKRDMLLNVGTKLDPDSTDQTPTPIRLIQKCEEMGLFQDLQTINPFEETFRKAAEGIRSGAAPLEVSSLAVPNNTDDSLHTPHVIFPNPNEVTKRRRPISPRDDLSIPIIQHDADPLHILDDSGDEADKLVVQQEADTSEDTQTSNVDVSDINDEAALGQIQFLLRMPNGKMVQLSSLPVEQMDSVTRGTKENDIPIIKVDSSFLKSAGDEGSQNSHRLGSTSIVPNISSNKIKGSSAVDSGSSKDADRSSNLTTLKKTNTLNDKMSIAKQKLKHRLMNNSCPATNSKSSPGAISSNEFHSASARVSSPEPELSHVDAKSGSGNDDAPHEMNWMEEKRKRNRAAAMRCREKRKTWVKELERRANEMLRTNGQLQHEVSMLRDEVAQLKTLLLAHRDCPVTQAMVQGKSGLPAGTNLHAPVPKTSAATKLQSSKGIASSPTIVIQTPAAPNNVKPRILLSDPPAKRKRLNSSTSSSSTNSPAASVSVVSSPPSSSPLHALVLPPKSSTVLNRSFMIPSVLVANPTTPTSTSLGTSHVIYSQFVPCLPAIAPNPVPSVVAPRQAYILPKAKSNPVPSGNGYAKVTRPEGKAHTTVLSTNVIKVNPNVVDRDNNDSDIEILDVK